MKKHLILTCLTILIAFSSFGLIIHASSGEFGSCAGSSRDLYVDSSTSGGGTWSSSNTAIASIASAGYYIANIYGVSAGVVTITYTLGASYATATFTVTVPPAAIVGASSICNGTSTTFTDASAGGVWRSSHLGVATIDSVTGVATGLSGGGTSIAYEAGPGCATYASLAIATTDPGYISGVWSLCVGTTGTLSETIAGGAWNSSNTAIATIDPVSGVATGVSAGTVNFSYTVSGTCGPGSTRDTVIVSSTTATATLSGSSSVMAGTTIDLTPSVWGGTWSSSSTFIATVDGYGTVTGNSAGTVTISYAVSGCSGPITTTMLVTVTAYDGISGHVILGYWGQVRIWLITYNPGTAYLEAVDSVTVSASGSGVYYQFPGVATDSYRVKATVSYDTSFTATGYIPTYHTSSYYWHDADVIHHISGTGDVNEDINMITGLSSAGPGFISGNVMTGANRGTSESDPVPNLLIYAINSATGALVQQTYTDASGNYSFTSLPLGTYLVHPELINYNTIPYLATLSSGSASTSSATFIQHTVSHVISPVKVGVQNTQIGASSVTLYPNPASDKFNLVWNEATTETGNVTLADITGKEVYKTSISMTAGSGTTQLHLPTLADGSYLLTVKSANISYNNKIEIQH